MKLEPVASVHVSHFRQSPAMRNIEWEEISTIPDGSHKLYTIPSGYVLVPVEMSDEAARYVAHVLAECGHYGEIDILIELVKTAHRAMIEGEQ